MINKNYITTEESVKNPNYKQAELQAAVVLAQAKHPPLVG
jgi:hypothetical protein